MPFGKMWLRTDVLLFCFGVSSTARNQKSVVRGVDQSGEVLRVVGSPTPNPFVSRGLPAVEASANSREVFESRLLPFVSRVVDAYISVVDAEDGGHFAGEFFGT